MIDTATPAIQREDLMAFLDRPNLPREEQNRISASPSSQSKEIHTMATSKKNSVNRRGFLKGAAAGAAALVTKPAAGAVQNAPARAAAQPVQLPSAALVAAETSPPPRA